MDMLGVSKMEYGKELRLKQETIDFCLPEFYIGMTAFSGRFIIQVSGHFLV